MAIKPVTHTKPTHTIFLRTPLGLLERIDAFARRQGFKTRTSAVFKLIHEGLRRHEEQTYEQELAADGS
jgi:metal-responsive CopG/Arc/MetJ family transcriptional regulator